MRKRPNFKAMTISAEEEDNTPELKSSLAFTAGGSLQLKDFHINNLGLCSSISLEEISLDKELGRGASSIVYKGTHTPTGQLLAVKMLTNLHDKELRKQLVAEMQFLKPKLKESPSPFLLQIYDAYYADDKTYIVLEFCGKGPLDTNIRKFGPAPEPALSVIMRQIFLGLCYLYNNGIVHRDMKPANCLVDDNGVCKIADFGSSKDVTKGDLQSPGVAEGLAETFTGTTRYMSPERLAGEPYSWPADVWCGGMIMLEIGLGEHPYNSMGTGGSFIDMMDYVKRDTPELPSQYGAEATEFVNLCLAKEAHARPAPIYMVNEADPPSSHPFIAMYGELGNEQVLQWLGG